MPSGCPKDAFRMPRLLDEFSTIAATPKRTPLTCFSAQLLAETTALVVDKPLHTRQEISLQTLHVKCHVGFRPGLTQTGAKLTIHLRGLSFGRLL